MAYATVADIFKRYNPITTMVGTIVPTDITTTDIASIYIADAESIVNAFLARTYVVPVQAEPIVTQITSDIAIYKILEDRAPRIPDFCERRYTNCMSLLQMLSDSKIVLTASGTLVNSGGDEEVWSTNLETPPVFTNVEAQSWSHANSQWCDG